MEKIPLRLLPPENILPVLVPVPEWEQIWKRLCVPGSVQILQGQAGTGKSWALLKAAQELSVRCGAGLADGLVVLAPTRARADELSRLGAGFLRTRVLTPTGLAVQILNAHHLARGDERLGDFAHAEEVAPEGVVLRLGAEDEEQMAELLRSKIEQAQPGPARAFWERLGEMEAAPLVRDFLAECNHWNFSETELYELAVRYEIEEWRYLAQLLTESNPGINARVFNSAQLQKTACDLVSELWERAHGEKAPHPRYVLVDDLQDFPQVFGELLGAWLRTGKVSLLATSNPPLSVENFRGANPDLAATLSRACPEACLVDTTPWPRSWDAPPRPYLELASPRTRFRLSGNEEEQVAQIACFLREQRREHGFDWDEMAVIVRGSASAHRLSSLLRAKELPARAGRRAIVFSRNPVTAPLLALFTLPPYPLGLGGDDLAAALGPREVKLDGPEKARAYLRYLRGELELRFKALEAANNERKLLLREHYGVKALQARTIEKKLVELEQAYPELGQQENENSLAPLLPLTAAAHLRPEELHLQLRAVHAFSEALLPLKALLSSTETENELCQDLAAAPASALGSTLRARFAGLGLVWQVPESTPPYLASPDPALLEPLARRAEAIKSLLASPFIALTSAQLQEIEIALAATPWQHTAFYARLGTPEAAFPAQLDELIVARLRLAHSLIVAAQTEPAGFASPLERIWELWKLALCGPAGQWEATALSPTSERQLREQADFYLDSLINLQRHCDVYQQRHPQARIRAYAEYLLELDREMDTLAVLGQSGKHITCTTPQGAAGRSWKCVVVAELQEKIWPSRLAADPLGTTKLSQIARYQGHLEASLLAHLTDPVRVASERRRIEFNWLVCSLSRATHSLLLTAIENTETTPSAFFYLLARHAGQEDQLFSPPTPEPEPHPLPVAPPEESLPVAPLPPEDSQPYHEHEADSLRALVAELICDLVEGDETTRENSARILAFLAREHVPYADPRSWAMVGETNPDWHTSQAPIYSPTSRIYLSPSKIELLEKCPLKYFFQHLGGENIDPNALAIEVGNALHEVAELHDRDPQPARDTAYHLKRPHDRSTWLKSLQDRKEQSMLDQLGLFLDKQLDTHRLNEYATTTQIAPHLYLNGKIDRLCFTDEGLNIYDFKTGRPISRPEAATSRQLQAYQLLVQAQLRLPPHRRAEDFNRFLAHSQEKVSGAALVYLKASPSQMLRTQEPLTAEQIEQVKGEFEQICAPLRRAHYEATSKDASVCLRCPATPICPLKQASADEE